MQTEVPPPPRRRFTIVDAMILVAFTAVALLPVRLLGSFAGWDWLPAMIRSLPGASPRELAGLLLFIGLLSTYLAAPLSLAALVLRWIPPRPARSDVLRQPGILGLGIALALLLIVTPPALLSMWALDELGGVFDLDYLLIWFVPIEAKFVGVIVLAVRLTLRASIGPMPAPADWVDRFARVLSWYWIVLGLAMPPILFG